jgi:hypothetical protein
VVGKTLEDVYFETVGAAADQAPAEEMGVAAASLRRGRGRNRDRGRGRPR